MVQFSHLLVSIIFDNITSLAYCNIPLVIDGNHGIFAVRNIERGVAVIVDVNR